MIRATPRPYSPGQPCPKCAGHGVSFSRERSAFLACPECAGVATVGLFVIRTVTRTAEEERSWQTRDYHAAARRARRLARLLSRFHPDTPVRAVRVVYRSPAVTPASCPACGSTTARAGQEDGHAVYTAHVLRPVSAC